MFNWFKKTPNETAPSPLSKASSVLDIFTNVYNASVSALSGKDLFGFMLREKKYNSINRGMNLSAVYCALSMYTSAITALPRHIVAIDPNTGKRLRRVSSVDNVHPAIRIFLHYATPSMLSTELIGFMVNDILIDGNFYALREFDSQGRTYRVNYIHPSRIPRGNIKLATGKEKFYDGRPVPKGVLTYRLETGDSYSSIDNEAMYVTRDMIMHIKGSIPDIENNRSFGIIENAGRSFNFYENAETYGNKFFENGTNNQSFLTTDQKLSPDVLKRLEAFFDKNPNAPLEEAFKTRILDQGVKPMNVALPLGQLQFIETRAFSVEDIARWFSIPPELLHSRMGTGGSGMDLAELISLFIQWGIGPLLTLIANQIKSELLPLSSQLNYEFQFERIYLYRTVINEFSQALRNLFEIGVLDRDSISNMIGLFIDPKDKMNQQRYIPTNLMTVGHSIALEEKAETANKVLEEQLRKLELDNENYVSPTDMYDMQMKAKAETKKAPEKDKADTSPDEHNLDKRLTTAKNAFTVTINGLHTYYTKVWDSKKEKHPEDVGQFTKAMAEFTDNKFLPLLTTTLSNWDGVLNELTPFKTSTELIDLWKKEGYDAVITRINNETST